MKLNIIARLKRYARMLNILRHGLWNVAFWRAHFTYSLVGEDVMMRPFFEGKFDDPHYSGFWVDVGAFDPVAKSNTFIYSLQGWRGINIEPNPDGIRKFNRYRPCDINVNAGVGECSSELEYYMFPGAMASLNSFSKSHADYWISQGVELKEVRKIPVMPLADILGKYLPKDQHVDFLTIDAEGFDIEVLRSNDWDRFRPDFVLIEIHAGGHNESLLNSDVALFLRDKGYEFVAQAYITTLFRRIGYATHVQPHV